MLTETLWNGAMDREWVFNPLKARVASVPTQQLLQFLLLCSVLCLPKGFPGSSGVRISLPMEETGDAEVGSMPGSGRYPGEGNGNPLQYSCLENPTDRGAW